MDWNTARTELSRDVKMPVMAITKLDTAFTNEGIFLEGAICDEDKRRWCQGSTTYTYPLCGLSLRQYCIHIAHRRHRTITPPTSYIITHALFKRHTTPFTRIFVQTLAFALLLQRSTTTTAIFSELGPEPEQRAEQGRGSYQPSGPQAY
jgi:hypothetical protein